MSSKVKKVTNINKVTDETPMPISGTILALNDAALRAISVLASSTLFNAPQFALQATPASIVALADTFYKYFVGELTPQETEQKVQAPIEAPKFS